MANEHEALRRIREALQDQSNSLDLVGLDLTQLPPEIGQFSQLTSLNLSFNRLAELGPEIAHLVLTPAGEYLWLCPAHHREFEPGLPKLD